MRRLASLFAAGALALSSHAATAAPDSNVAQASALFKEGVRLFQAGDFEGARGKFVVANGLVKSDGILWNLALAEAKSGHSADALNHFRSYLRSPKARPGDVQEAQTKWVPQMQGQAGELQIDGAEGASVTVDGGDAVGVLPMGWPYAVAPGHHRVEGHLGSGVTASREVDVGVGQTITVHLVGAAPAVAQVPVIPSAAVVDTTAGAPATSAVPAETTTHAAPLRTWMTVGFGVAAVASLVGGVVFAAQSKSKASDAQQIAGGLAVSACPGAAACATLNDDYSAENRDHTLSTVFYVGAGGFAAASLLSFLLLPKTTGEAHSAFAPMIAPGLAGARWVTTF